MNERECFDLVYEVGETMLRNGAEINRVETTINRMAEALELQDFSSFVMVNAMFMTARLSDETVQAKVKDIPISPINLGRIEQINTLSRQISEKKMTAEEAFVRIKEIKKESFSTDALKIFGYGFGSASFCYIFGGTLLDSMGAFVLGIVLALYSLYIIPKLDLSHIVATITSSALVSALACVMFYFLPDIKLTSLITGGIISLLPGVALVNGIRYLLDGDYSSGWGQMVNAIVIAMCMSIGVGMVLRVFSWL